MRRMNATLTITHLAAASTFLVISGLGGCGLLDQIGLPTSPDALVCPPGKSVFVGSLPTNWMPRPQGFLGNNTTLVWSLGLQCGLAVCAEDRDSALIDFGEAVGDSPADAVTDERLFVTASLGTTGREAEMNKLAYVAQWYAQHKTCFSEKGDAGSGACAMLEDPCSTSPKDPTTLVCCVGLTCETAVGKSAGHCCVPSGQPGCLLDTDCCGEGSCAGPNSTCCVTAGSACLQDLDCCQGFQCLDGLDGKLCM